MRRILVRYAVLLPCVALLLALFFTPRSARSYPDDSPRKSPNRTLEGKTDAKEIEKAFFDTTGTYAIAADNSQGNTTKYRLFAKLWTRDKEGVDHFWRSIRIAPVLLPHGYTQIDISEENKIVGKVEFFWADDLLGPSQSRAAIAGHKKSWVIAYVRWDPQMGTQVGGQEQPLP